MSHWTLAKVDPGPDKLLGQYLEVKMSERRSHRQDLFLIWVWSQKLLGGGQGGGRGLARTFVGPRGLPSLSEAHQVSGSKCNE